METYPFAVSEATRLLERLAFQVNSTLHTPSGSDPVHDLRVAIRRFSQILSTCKPCFHAKDLKKIRRRLKQTMDFSSVVRDCDIALKLLEGWGKESSAELEAQLTVRRKNAARDLTLFLKSWIARKTFSKWRTKLHLTVPEKPFLRRPVEQLARKEMHGMVRQFLRDGEEASAPGISPVQLHHFRIEGKKLRYTLEIFAGIFGAEAERLLQQLRDVQTTLGHIADCRALRDLVADLHGVADFDAYLKRRQGRKIQKFRKQWKATFGDKAIAAHWMHAFDHVPRKPVARSASHPRRIAQAQA